MLSIDLDTFIPHTLDIVWNIPDFTPLQIYTLAAICIITFYSYCFKLLHITIDLDRPGKQKENVDQ